MKANFVDVCDCCGSPMKYHRISPSYLLACQECRDEAMRRLGRTVTAIQISMRAAQ